MLVVELFASSSQHLSGCMSTIYNLMWKNAQTKFAVYRSAKVTQAVLVLYRIQSIHLEDWDSRVDGDDPSASELKLHVFDLYHRDLDCTVMLSFSLSSLRSACSWQPLVRPQFVPVRGADGTIPTPFVFCFFFYLARPSGKQPVDDVCEEDSFRERSMGQAQPQSDSVKFPHRPGVQSISDVLTIYRRSRCFLSSLF